jgi:hypothetical protein
MAVGAPTALASTAVAPKAAATPRAAAASGFEID